MILRKNSPLIYVIISASLFGVSAPLSKALVSGIPPVMLAGLLYFGAFAGLAVYSAIARKSGKEKAPRLGKRDIPWLAGAVISGGVLAPISLMFGLTFVSGFTASLFLNLEGIATAMIAVLLFKENAGKHLWLALICMTIAGVFLAWDPGQNRFNVIGPLLILLAMICWGIDNNLTRIISDKDPVQIAKIKGLTAGVISLSISLIIGFKAVSFYSVLSALLVGAFSYGLSLVLFIKALEGLGSARTGAFFSLAPFIGAVASLAILKESTGWVIFPAVAFMTLGVWLIVKEKHAHSHYHEKITHTHIHSHDDMHHLHKHPETFKEPHSHEHTHEEIYHSHVHWPDTSHRHKHDKEV